MKPEGLLETKDKDLFILPRTPEKANPDFSILVTKKQILEDVALPVFIGYTGKITAFSLETLANLGSLKELANLGDLEPLEPTVLVDPREIKNYVSKCYTQSQIRAIVAEALNLGMMERGLWKFILPVAVISGIIILTIIAMVLLPQIAKQTTRFLTPIFM